MKTDLLRGTREKLRTGIIDKTMTHETRIAELERTPTTGSVQVERQIVSAIGGGGGGSVAISYATTAEIADVTTTEAAGTSSLVARGDHVHAHSQLNTGDLHQDYILAAGTRALSGDWAAGDGRTITVGAYVAGYASDLTRLAIRVYGGAHFAIKSPNYVAIGNQGDGVIVDQTVDDVGQPDSKAIYGRMYLTANTGTNTHIHNAMNAYLSVSSFGATWSAESAALSAVAAVANADGGTLANVAAAQFYASNAGVDGTVTTIRLAHFKTTTGAGTSTFGTLKAIDIDNIGTGITTLSVGIEIAAQSGPATAIGLRNAATTRLVDAVTIGADAAVTAGQILSITGSVGVSGYERVGSLTAPTNTTAGDLTATRLIVPNATIVHSAINQLGGPVVIPAAGALRFSDSDNSHYTGLKANNTTTTTVTYSLPAADGSAGYFLKTDGAGNLSWDTASGSGVTLDGAYDQGGAGAGRTINADSGPVTIQPTTAMADPTTAGLLWVKDMILVEAYNYTTDLADDSMQAMEIKGQAHITGRNTSDNGHSYDLFWGDYYATAASASSSDNKCFFGTTYLNVLSGTSSHEHAGVAGNIAIAGTIDYTGIPSGGRFAVTLDDVLGTGSSGTKTSAAAVKVWGQAGSTTSTAVLTDFYGIHVGDARNNGGGADITNYIAFKMANLSTLATNFWGAQWGTAANGSYINHKLKLGAASEATAGYILDAVGNVKVTGTMEISSTTDLSGLTTLKGATALRFNNSGNTFYSEAKAGAAVHNQQLVLPIDIPSTGEVLKIDSVTGTNPYVIALKWAADDTGSGALPISANTQLSGGAFHLYIDTASSGIHFYDSRKLLFGTGTGIGTGDAEIYYNGTDLIIEPNAIGTGGVKVLGTMALGTASVTNTILISGTLTTDNDSFSGVSAVLNYSNTTSGTTVLSNANQYQVNIQNVTAGSSVAPSAMYLEFNYKNTISNSATLGGNGLVIYFNNESSYGLASQVGIQISLVADGTGSSDVAKAIFIADPSPVGTTGDIAYGLHMDNFDGSTSPTRWPIYYGDAGTPYWTLNHNAEMAMRVQGTNPTSVTANTVLQYGRNHTLGNTMWMRDENGRESSPTFRGRFIAPMPLNITSTTSSGVTLANTSTGYVGLVNFPTPISVTQIRMRLTTIAVGGTPVIRIAVYDERGQNKLIDVVTTAALTGGSARNIDTAVSPAVMLPPGNYYICIGLQTAASTTQPTIAMWADNTLSAFWNDGGGSEPDLVGTIAFTAGAAPTTFDPTSAITVTASRCPLLAFQGGAL